MGLFGNKNKKPKQVAEPLPLSPEQMTSGEIKPIPCDDESVDHIARQLENRLKMQLNGIIAEVVDTAIDNTRIEIEQILRNELISMLESRLDQLAEQAIKTQFTKSSGP